MPEEGDGFAAAADTGITDPSQTDDQGTSSETWLSTLPDELREHPTLTKFKEQAELARSYINLEKKISEKGIIKPKDDAPPEDWEKYHIALGRPETPDAYEIGRPEGLPDEFPYSEELEGLFKKWAYEEGLTAKQTKNLFNKYIQTNIAEYNKASKIIGEAKEKAEEILRKEWGDNFANNLELARKARRQFAPDQGPEWDQLELGLGNNPILVKMFANIGARMSEGELVKGETVVKTAEQERTELMNHPAYMDGNHPEHNLIVEKVRKAWGLELPPVT